MRNGGAACLTIGGGALLALGSVTLVLSLNAAAARAEPLIPFVATSCRLQIANCGSLLPPLLAFSLLRLSDGGKELNGDG